MVVLLLATLFNYIVCEVVTHLLILVAVISGQNCTDTVGSLYLNSGSSIVYASRTFILADYQTSCEGNVTAWEFCYRKETGNKTAASFNASVWKISGENNDTFAQVNSSYITFTLDNNATDLNICQRVNLSTADQFTAPAGSVVGLYCEGGKMQSQLLWTDRGSSITTYVYDSTAASLIISDGQRVNYTITIKLHLG